jgi:hypothetical protein
MMVRRGLPVVLALAGQGCNPGTNGTGSSASESGSADTGTTATTSTDSSSESTDESTTGDEGCEPSPSTEPMRTEWVVTPDPGFAISMRHVVVTALGRVVVAGNVQEGPAAAWFASHADDGTLDWLKADDTVEGGVGGLVPDPIGGFVVATNTYDAASVRRYTSDGDLSWSEQFDFSYLYEGAGDNPQGLVAALPAVASDEDVYVYAGGRVEWNEPEPGVNRDYAVYRIAAGGGSPVELDFALPELVGGFIVATPEDDLVIFGKRESDWDTGWIGKFTTAGEEVWSRTVDAEPYNIVRRAAGAPDERTLWAFADGPDAGTATFWVGMLDASGGDDWAWSDPACNAVSLEDIVVVGTTSFVTRHHEPPDSRNFLQAFNGDGAPLWAEVLPDAPHGVVLASSSDSVYVAALTGEGLDIRYYLARIAL